MEPRFKSIEELLKDHKFENIIWDSLHHIEDKRDEVLKQVKDFDHSRDKSTGKARLRRGTYDLLVEKDMLNPDDLGDEYLLIVAKKSKFSARDRDWIKFYVDDAIWKTVQFYAKQEKEQAKLELEVKPNEPEGPGI